MPGPRRITTRRLSCQGERRLAIRVVILLACALTHIAAADAFRSVDVTFRNLSNQALTKINQDRPHGIWVTEPPAMIAPGAVVHWRSESQGFNTGTEAWVLYRMPNGAQVRLWWDNPAEGTNNYDIATPAGFEGEHIGGVGNNANVELVLRPIQRWTLSAHHEPITDLRVRVITAEINLAGTNNNVWFDIGPLQWKLGDDFQSGSDHTFTLDLGTFRGNITTADITRLRLHKKGVAGVTNSPDGVDGEWKPRQVILLVNGRPVYDAFPNKWLKAGDPLWTRYLMEAPLEELFARSQRLEKHDPISAGDENVAILTTEFKLAGVSGWCHAGQNWCHELIPDTCAIGTIYLRPAVSTDGLATIDLVLESVDVGQQHFDFDENHGFTLPRYLRVEYKFGPLYAALPRGISQPKLPGQGDRVRICGEVRWDSDLAGWYEIHPKATEQVAVLGPKPQQFIGQFDSTIYSKETLYAVKPTGELLWFADTVGINKNASQQHSAGLNKARREITRPGGVPAASEKSSRMMDKARTTPVTGQLLHDEQLTGPIQITHKLQGPKVVGTGWQNFRSVIPAGQAGFYALTPDGVLKWYRHDGFNDGTPAWKGPVDVGTGWNSFQKIVAAGDGVLYGIGADGSLRWYRHTDAADASSPAHWQGPQVVGQGWGDFAHVFSTGEGVIYAITKDGRLMWYRHAGYLTGAPQWQGPKQVGSGWANFTSVFSPGYGVIYAVSPAGDLLYYQNDGYLQGSTVWLGPILVTAGWGSYLQVFPRMWGTPQPQQIH